ncbi:hypothetical protein ABPG75_007040 [Micractinium tetrahymenae]
MDRADTVTGLTASAAVVAQTPPAPLGAANKKRLAESSLSASHKKRYCAPKENTLGHSSVPATSNKPDPSFADVLIGLPPVPAAPKATALQPAMQAAPKAAPAQTAVLAAPMVAPTPVVAAAPKSAPKAAPKAAAPSVVAAAPKAAPKVVPGPVAWVAPAQSATYAGTTRLLPLRSTAEPMLAKMPGAEAQVATQEPVALPAEGPSGAEWADGLPDKMTAMVAMLQGALANTTAPGLQAAQTNLASALHTAQTLAAAPPAAWPQLFAMMQGPDSPTCSSTGSCAEVDKLEQDGKLF